MIGWSMDELVLLPEQVAVQRHFDTRNLQRFRWLLLLFAAMSLTGLGFGVEGTIPSGRLAFFAVTLAAVLALLTIQREPFFTRAFRPILLSFLFAQAVAARLWNFHSASGSELQLSGLLLVAFLLVRLRLLEHLVLYGTYALTWVPSLGLTSPAPGTTPPRDVEWLFHLGGAAVFLGASLSVTHLERRRFLVSWRHEQARARERLRLREEIETARQIQLSMLPQNPPNLAWLELSGVCLPATEVGGDYYDYFRLSSDRLALVVGDVAGHGLASGLLLSGVRSCLYLLEDGLTEPVAVLERLNHMVRRTTGRRTFVTLLCVVLDRESSTLVVTNAGHPLLLRWRAASREVEELGAGAPPLGTFLDARYVALRCPFAPGDLLALYTDGLTEARNAQGDAYGEARLRSSLARAARARVAREVRDSILSDLANFKGNAEQVDDITLVIARVR